MWTAESVVGWLSELGIAPGGAVDVEWIGVGGPGIGTPTMPDRVAVVIPTPGAGLLMGEGQFDRLEFTLLIRGPQGNPHAAEVMAQAADRLILAAATSVLLSDGTYLLSVDRTARPAPLVQGRDGDRATYTASYTTQINDEG